MSRSSDARRKRRAIKRTGVARLNRVTIDGAAMAKAVTEGVNLIDLVAYHVANALTALDESGGDVLAHTVVTIGEHPDYPGDLTIEAKAANLKADSDVDPGCPIDHSLDAADDDEAVGPTAGGGAA